MNDIFNQQMRILNELIRRGEYVDANNRQTDRTRRVISRGNKYIDNIRNTKSYENQAMRDWSDGNANRRKYSQGTYMGLSNG